MGKKKAKLIISREAFVGWYFQNEEDFETITGNIIDSLEGGEKYTICIDDLFESLCYIPLHLIKNKKDNKVKELTEDEEISEPSADFTVKWVK